MAASRKRKAAKQGFDKSYDSDVAVVRRRSERRALGHVSVPEAQNKRRRIADCVLIPVSRETRKLIADLKFASLGPRATQSTCIPTPSNKEDAVESEALPVFRSSTSRRLPQQTGPANEVTRISVADATDVQFNVELSSKRPRRSGQRVSYVQAIDYSDDSAEDVSVPTRWLQRKSESTKASKKPTSDSSDYEEFAAEAVSEDDLSSDNSEELLSEASIEDASEDDMLPARRKRVTPYTHKVGTQPSTTGLKRGHKISKEMLNLMAVSKGLDLSLPPLHNIDEIYVDLVRRSLPLGLSEAVKSLDKKRLRVATMCSGTESPLLAVEMIRDSLKTLSQLTFDIDHLFSAEIVPFKQAYIERNFRPPIIFRNIEELVDVVDDNVPMATTAYGAKARVPTDIDMVIAGTSCVDFSIQNKHRKEITEDGESAGTWRAVLAFCKAFRPPIVILENVKFAPWDYMLQDYRDAGYEPAGAYVDTKNFYLPQTRQRGYMVCFDAARLRDAGLSSAGATWKSTMGKMQRKASSPVSSFLLPSDQIAPRPLQADEDAKEVDWSRCEITQMAYRLEKKLGVSRPITNWSESGSMLPPDYGSRPWHGAQVERVLDTLDVAVLRKAREGYDARFKTRVWDLSQNAHRQQDANQFGLIGCITPSGLNFVSDSWRAMTPEECLVLQGIPLKRISFTVETKAQIQDLAGNAMSGPLVGAAILSSLIAGGKMFKLPKTLDKDLRPPRQVSKEQAPHRKPEIVEVDMQSVAWEVSDNDVDIGSLHQDAERALRRCYCEGPLGLTNRPIQKCADCGATTCIACGGNPEHNYVQSQSLAAGRKSMTAFEESLRSKLPLRLSLANMPDWSANPAPHQFYKAIRPLASATFSLSTIRRSHCIRVLYTASEGRLELCLSEGNASWHLYAASPADLAGNASLRDLLSQPVAESRIERSLLGNSWKWRSPEEQSNPAVITGSGDHLPTWWARMQMPEYINHWQWEYLQVEASRDEIDGSYQYLAHCGTACESLYKRVNPRESEPVYLFLDATRVGAADMDCFTFARDHSKLEYDETRQVLARLDSAWRPWAHSSEGSDPKSRTEIKYHEWSQAPASLRLEPGQTDLVLYKPASIDSVVNGDACHQTIMAMSAQLDFNLETGTCHSEEDCSVQLDDERFFSKHGWIFEVMRRHLTTNEWIEMPTPAVTMVCADCAPAKPSLRWKLTDDGSITSYEDPRTAADYERAIKHRPSPVLVHVKDRRLGFGINLASLAHRASARLPPTKAGFDLSWRLSTSVSAEAFTKKFRLISASGVRPYDGELRMSMKLHPNQRIALAWMQEQESGSGKQILLEETEEALIPHLGWRVEVCARAMQSVKGGICADHPGFGKTITSLALVHSEWLERGANGIRKALNDTASSTAGIFTSSATVVICPKILVDQWYTEACGKLRSKDKIIVVKDAPSLTKYSIDDFESARLIIVSRQVFTSEVYTERLAAWAGMPGPAADKGRAYAEWLKHATEQLPEHLEILQKSGKTELVKYLQKKYRERVTSEDFVGYVPSKRLKGKYYVEASLAKGKIKESKTKAKTSAQELPKDLLGGLLFEMFHFNRIIVDEFHSCDAKEIGTITALKADKRWGLSGTPQHSDCYDVAQLARLLGLQLGFGSMQRGVMRTGNIRALNSQMTGFEKFDAARTAPSGHQNGRIQELAQKFLNTFVRRNVMDFEGLSVNEHLIPTTLSPIHHATYHELSQHLNSSDMKIRKSMKSRKTDRDQQFADAVDKSETAEEALSKSAAYPRRVDLPTSSPSRQSSLGDWIEKREEESETLLRELGLMLRDARAKEREEYIGWREARVDAEKLQDKETAAIVKKLCREAESAADDGARETTRAGSKRELTSQVNKLVNRLLSSRRSVRYLLNVRRLQHLAVAGKDSPKHCHHSECRTKLSTDSRVAVSGLCGHLVCTDCYIRLQSKKETGCPADGCGTLLASHHLLWNHKLKNIHGARHTEHGAKIDAAISVLEKIKAKRQQAVLFVQFESQLAEVERAISSTSIPNIVITTARNAAAQLATFVEDPEKTVIVFNASSEAAEGLNLQNANHVLFLSPLLRDSQYSYESTMAQAVGRVRRHGQEEQIHVYRFVALNTIDVDILEHRERRNEALIEEGAPAIQPPEVAKMLDMSSRVDSGRNGAEAERVQLVVEDGKFSLRPRSWLVECGAASLGGEDGKAQGQERVRGRRRVGGWEDFSSLVKFSRVFVEDDE